MAAFVDLPACSYGSVKGCICNVCLSVDARRRGAYKRKQRKRRKALHTIAKKVFQLNPTESKYKFEDLCPPHRQGLVMLAKSFTNGNEAEAEDLVQEAMFRAYTFWFQFKQETENVQRDVKVWLRRILSNIFYSQYSKGQRHLKSFEVYENTLDVTLQEDTEGADIAKVHEAIQKLKPDQKELIELFYAEGYSYQELADKFDMTFTKVQKKLWRARQNLKNILLESGFVDAPPLKAPKPPQADTDTIDSVVGDDDTVTFVGGEPAPDSLTSW